MDYPGSAAAREDTDHVEADRLEMRPSLGDVPFGQGADGGLLAGGDGLERIPEADTEPQLHFYEDQRLGTDVQTLELRFRAQLVKGGVERLELVRA